MELIDCGVTGSDEVAEVAWSAASLDPQWKEIATLLSGSDTARPVQWAAIHERSLFESRRNLVVSSSTNSGKTLVGLLMLLQSVTSGGRALLIEPLRALAEEKAQQLREVLARLSKLMGIDIDVVVSTGDYRCRDEMMQDPPPDHGQFVIATPERVESIIRNPDHRDWLSSITAVCLDEAHLISVSKRGLLIENVITTFNSLPSPPRIALLSATLTNSDQLCEWLRPCDMVCDSVRTPSLTKRITKLQADESVDDVVSDMADEILEEPKNSIIMFVYQTRSTEKLAQSLRDRFGDHVAVAYHSRMNSSARAAARDSFTKGDARVVVTTSALAMGVNLPATHVIVRDLLYPGIGRVPDHEIMQMIGRAGRRRQPGHAILIAKPDCPWEIPELVQLLHTEQISDSKVSARFRYRAVGEFDAAVAERVASRMSTMGSHYVGVAELEDFFRNSLTGDDLAGNVSNSVAWLSDCTRVLAHTNNENAAKLTRLGKQAVHAFFPLPYAASCGLLLRDLLEIDPQDKLLGKWTSLDHLIVLELLSNSSPLGLRFSEPLADNVDGWIEQNDQKAVLYVNWLRGADGKGASELLGSLGVSVDEKKARQLGYKAVASSIILYERGLGKPTSDLVRRWKCTSLDGVEEKWRDHMIWLLGAYASILDRRTFFYHLEATLESSQDRIDRVGKIMKQLQFQVYALQEHIKYCSPLGGILRSLKRTAQGKSPSIGIQSIRRLEAAGIENLAALARSTEDDLIGMGLRRKPANALLSYVKRRMS